jgi:hypothetical protein
MMMTKESFDTMRNESLTKRHSSKMVEQGSIEKL